MPFIFSLFSRRKPPVTEVAAIEKTRRNTNRFWLLLLLCTCWVLPGLLAHDPWKPDEAYTFGLVNHILQTGDWIIPTLAGEAFMEKPPLFFLTAALFAKIFSPVLALHDGARLATGFYVGLTLLFSGMAGRELYGRGWGWMTNIILIGCLGFLVRSHQLVTDTALMAGFALSLYGFSLSARRPRLAGLLLGMGVGMGFMSKGLIAPGMVGVTALALLLFKPWRSKAYILTLSFALVAVLPWLLIWPYAVYQRSPELFQEWLWVNNFGRFLGFAKLGPTGEAGYYFKILPWFAWPALPLALLTLWQRGRADFAKPQIHLPLVSFVVMLGVLSIASDARELYALPMLLPLSLLATASVDNIRRGASSALDWFGIMTFGILGALLWLGWIAMQTGYPAAFAERIFEYQPGFVPRFNIIAFAASFIFSLLWIALIRPARRSNRRAVINWAGGVTLCWMLAMTLWLPLLDAGKSYRSMAASMALALPDKYKCIASRSLGEPQRAMLEYYANIVTRRVELADQKQCELLLVQSGPDEESSDKAWQKIWEGSRPGDKSERFRLYKRKNHK